jgi:hypothetical protein
MYIVYEPADKAIVRQQQITEDAQAANLLHEELAYEYLTMHPTEDKAALQVIITEGIYYNHLPIPSINYSIFFTAQELARAVPELTADWRSEPNNQ